MDFTKTTSASDLKTLLKKMNITDFKICRKHELKKLLLNKNYKNYIINLDDVSLGSHWVALNSDKKIYFDSYMQPPPIEIPKKYKRVGTHKQLQSIDSTDCGGLCALWLYYINFKSNNEYLKLFKDVYLEV